MSVSLRSRASQSRAAEHAAAPRPPARAALGAALAPGHARGPTAGREQGEEEAAGDAAGAAAAAGLGRGGLLVPAGGTTPTLRYDYVSSLYSYYASHSYSLVSYN